MKGKEKGYGGGAAIPFFYYLGYIVQTCLNRISLEVDEMDSADQVIYKEKNMTVKVERVYIGDKTAKEQVLELLKKRRVAGEIRS